ncbi:MAG: T9SS type A sorting domain-containing protein [Bacteroidia bacterium]
MQKILTAFLILSFLSSVAFSQTILEANGPGDTYELINSVLAPGHNVVEVPDCGHTSFGRHIEEVFDTDLNQHVFLFHMHKSEDDDRCQNFDRQRNEIKTYDKSPDSLLGIVGEKVEYRWKFKLDSTFQPSGSFSHLHQLKAVGGSESSMPLITLTARKSNPDRLELRYAESTSQVTNYQTPLAPLKGKWLEAKETVIYGELGTGEYEVLLTDMANGDTLFYYINASIRMWKTDADFIRPKWGLYRSLNDATNLKDEQVLFADFRIEELSNISASIDIPLINASLLVYPNPTQEHLRFADEVLSKFEYFHLYDARGKLVLSESIQSETISLSYLDSGLYFLRFMKDDLTTSSIKIVKR